ncbi:MAG: hypothetical protein ACFB2X_03115 [Rivularia sp. (in: cyanobacteria)]
MNGTHKGEEGEEIWRSSLLAQCSDLPEKNYSANKICDRKLRDIHK